ncbi:MAG TPA: R3H domain-containing nucleic acid-binding protein, partial [Deinococcales bacterium]|nr:R3H domain-containing nucleic acid-binding protein [Deinococcales bacterium]
PMDEPKSKLDAYLENLGISDDAEEASPVLPVGRPPAETPAAAPQPAGEEPVERPRRLIASPDAIVEDFLGGMLVYLDPGYSVQARQRGDHVAAEVMGGDSGRIIGREGRTLQAVEFLANTILAKEAPNSGLRVSVDAAGYRRRHEERLMETAQRAAARVRKHGQASELEPMNAADRRIIHIALREDPFVTTESVGEGRDRRVIVKLR